MTLIRPIPTLGVLPTAPHTRKADIRPNGVGQLSAESVAKLPKCRATNFPRKDETSDDRRSMRFKPVAGIACEFDAQRRSPPHNYSIVAPTARRI
jgi:hypothetical protein